VFIAKIAIENINIPKSNATASVGKTKSSLLVRSNPACSLDQIVISFIAGLIVTLHRCACQGRPCSQIWQSRMQWDFQITFSVDSWAIDLWRTDHAHDHDKFLNLDRELGEYVIVHELLHFSVAHQMIRRFRLNAIRPAV
jgi:hypothetical protein